jgi:general secretion pathway protein E
LDKKEQDPQLTEKSKKRVKNVVLRFIEGSHRRDLGETEGGEIEKTASHDPNLVQEIEPGGDLPPTDVNEELTPVERTEDEDARNPEPTFQIEPEREFSPSNGDEETAKVERTEGDGGHNVEPTPEIELEREFPPLDVDEEITPVEHSEDDREPEFTLSEVEAGEMKDRPLGEILLRVSDLEENQLEEGLRALEEKGGRLGDVLVKLGYVNESQVLYGLSLQMGMPFLGDVDIDDVDPEVSSAMPIHFAKKHGILPIKRDGDGVLVATSNPLNIYPLDDVRILLNQEVKPVVVPPGAIIDAINRVYDRDANAAQQIIEDFDEESLDIISSALEEPTDLLDASDEAPVIRLVNSILFQAAKQRASDVHIEPFERDLVVRYRIDGILYNVLTPPKRIQPSIISRVKIMAGLNIAEKRLPQDGRIRVTIAGKNIDIRVSIIPTAHGERIVMRLLDKTSILLKLEDIGFSTDKLRTFSRLIHRPHGIILLTGPTGGGKTTTLYAALTRINSPDKNIITVEDPIEYQIKGIGQIQVNPKINLTFANGLRSILRQDPDVIMVGEVRDLETSEIAIQASLTGHLVFSTLHTNDSAGAITRLIDMGIEPFLASSSLLAIMAQRLVRIVCTECRRKYLPSEEELREIGMDPALAGSRHLYRAAGCQNCLGTGYRGRTGIFELLVLDDDIRSLILKSFDANTIKRTATDKGMLTLRQDGARNVLRGITTIEEVLRVTQEDVISP